MAVAMILTLLTENNTTKVGDLANSINLGEFKIKITSGPILQTEYS